MEVDDRPRHLAEPVAESGVLQPEPEADRLAVGHRRVVGVLDLVEACLGARRPAVHDLAGTPLVAGPDHVELADLPAADPDLLGQPVEHTLERELRLVGAEPAERAAHQVVRAHGDRLDVERLPPVRAAGVAGRPFEHLHPDAGVRARVADAADLQRGETALGIAAGLVLEVDRMPLGVHPQALLARQRALHRPVEHPRGERRLRLIAHVLLAAERSPVRHQFDGHPAGVDRQHTGDVVAVVPHALAAGVDVERPLVAGTRRDGEGGFGLEERMLDPLRAERLPNGERARRERLVEVGAPLVAARRQDVRLGPPHRQGRIGSERGDRIGVGREHAVGDLDEFRRGAGMVPGVGHDDRQHVAGVRGPSADGDQHRPVLVDDPDRQFAGKVGGGEDGRRRRAPRAPRWRRSPRCRRGRDR